MGDCFGGRGDVHHVELEQQVDGDRRTHSVLNISIVLEMLTKSVFRVTLRGVKMCRGGGLFWRKGRY